MSDGDALVISEAKAAEFRVGGEKILADARLFVIQTADEYGMASEFRQQINGAISAIKAIVDPVVNAAHKAHKAATSLREKLIGNYNQANSIIDEKQKGFLRIQRQKEEELKAEQLKEATRIQEEMRLRLATKYEEAGDAKQAEKILDMPLNVVTPNVNLVPKVAGQSIAQIWKGECFDIVALAKFIVENPDYRHLISADTSALATHGRQTDGKVQIPGCRIYQEDSIRSSRK